MSKLIDLAERCEKATGPDKVLDFDIADAVGACYSYTASLDAAVTLVPESLDDRAVFWRLGNDGEGGNPGDFKAEILVASIYAAKEFPAVAETAPLALSAAALRARSA